jgi:hypothetical protein
VHVEDIANIRRQDRGRAANEFKNAGLEWSGHGKDLESGDLFILAMAVSLSVPKLLA